MPSRAAEPPIAWLVQLEDAPAAVVYREATGGEARPSAAALALARQLTRTRVARIEQAQQQVLGRITATLPSARVLYRTSKAMNGIVIEADANQVARLERLPGVKKVWPVMAEFPTTSTSVPFVEAQNVWDAAGFGATGEGVSIGIVDSGIDYQHPALGGTGSLAGYQANNRTVISETGEAAFPTARVVGGIDLVGDAYPGVAAVQDPDPMDCGGHGTHVATIAGGGGVNADGSAYTGPWDATTNFAGLRIGPGTAPRANLYAIRVFGCGGSTAFAAAGIEWAMDPNGDNDLSDHLDVLNLSLGSSFGGLSSSTTIAADNAAEAGVVMVISAGNSADTFMIGGSPSVSTRSISVANIADSGLSGTSLQVNSPVGIAGPYIAANSQIAPAVQPAPSGQTNDLVPVAGDAPAPAVPLEGCGNLTNAAALAGKFALVRRGNCNFSIKVENAQNAGAVGVVLYDNAVGEVSPIVLGGSYTVGFTPTIPVISVTNATGVAIQNAITNGDTVNVSLNAANAGGAISVSSSRGPRLDDAAPKPDIAAPGSSIRAAQTGITCLSGGGCITPDTAPGADGILEGGQVLQISGTSMAAPHVAGIAALLRQLHPTRSVEEIKAQLMNGAHQDVFLGAGSTGGRISTSRAGSGRANALNSAVLEVLAYNADGSGAVSIGFDPEIIGNTVQTRRLRLVNHGSSAMALNLALDVVKDSPGVAFGVPASVNVPANGSTVVDVTLTADAAQMKHPRDPATASAQTPVAPLNALGALGRHWLAEESALLTVSDGSGLLARVPVYVAPRATASMQVQSSIDTAGAATGSAPLAFTGVGLCSGVLAPPVCTVSDGDVLSIYSAFELQALSPRDPAIPARNDIRYVGVTTQPVPPPPAVPTTVRHVFAIGTYGEVESAYANTYQVELDFNNDGIVDNTLFNGDTGTVNARLFAAQADGQDVQFNYRITPAGSLTTVGHTGLFDPRTLDMRLYGNDVVFLHANRATLGLAADTTPFRYRVSTCFGGFPNCSRTLVAARLDMTGWIPWNPAAPGITVSPFLNDDQPGQTATLNWNTANLAANGSLGALVLHHHNRLGMTQQAVTLANTNVDVANDAADVAVGLSVDQPAPALGATVTFTLEATNNGPQTANLQTVFQLPEGLTYVSDNGAGAYVPATGVWTVNGLPDDTGAILEVTASVDRSGPIEAVVETVGNVVDPDLSNNRESVVLGAASTADLSVGISLNASPITAGGQATFTITLSNAGPDTAFSVDVEHDLGGLAVLPTSHTASAGAYDAATRTWTIGSVASNATETLQLTYTLNQAGMFTHTVTATHADNDPTVPNAGDTDITVQPGAVAELVRLAGNGQTALVNATFATDLSVRAEDSFDNPVPGATVQFTPPATGASGSFAASGSVVTDAGGVATAPDFTANGTGGNYIVTAGSGAASVGFSLQNLRIGTTTTLLSVPASANVGQDVTLTATVLDAQSAAVGSGAVTFSVAGSTICAAVPLTAGGTAQCVTSFGTAGSKTVRADFAQTASHLASFDEETVAVSRLSPTVSVQISPAPVPTSGNVTLTANVSGSGGTPGGTVTFVVDGVTVCAAVTLTAGSAQCATTASATAGVYPVVVTYDGNATYLSGTGNTQLSVGNSIFGNGFEGPP